MKKIINFFKVAELYLTKLSARITLKFPAIVIWILCLGIIIFDNILGIIIAINFFNIHNHSLISYLIGLTIWMVISIVGFVIALYIGIPYFALKEKQNKKE
jgi:hypothetical protein